MRQRLPDNFRGNLDEQGDGELIFRYGGKRFSVRVRDRDLISGWLRLTRQAKFVSGDVLLAAYSGGTTISLLKFRGGIGARKVWQSIADAYDVDSELLEESDIPDGFDGIDLSYAYLTSYFPPYMSSLFSAPSGVCVFKPTSNIAMKAPINLAQAVLLRGENTVDIRYGVHLFADVGIELGYFRGAGWAALVQACEFCVGFKIFFFLNEAQEFEMFVIGFGNAEVVYGWARTYYRVI